MPNLFPAPDLQFDERGGYTSASNAQADLLCPGRHIAQRGILKVNASKDADAGTKAHLVFSGELDISELAPSQKKIIGRAKQIEAHCHMAWLGSLELPAVPSDEIARRAQREQRLWYWMDGSPVHSGQADAIFFTEDMKHALIEDLKSLYGDTPNPGANAQLRDLAVLAWLAHGVETVTVFINQPGVAWKFEEQQFCTFDEKALAEAEKELRARLLASAGIEAQRKPNPVSCKFCRAAGTARCPESSQYALALAESAKMASFDGNTAAKRGKMIATLRAGAEAIDKMLDVAKAKIAEDPAWADGWLMTAKGSTQTFASGAAMEIAAEMQKVAGDKLTAAQIGAALLKCCKVSLTDVEAWFLEITEMKKKDFDDRFRHLISVSERSGSLKVKKDS